jgi:hypothetical protein
VGQDSDEERALRKKALQVCNRRAPLPASLVHYSLCFSLIANAPQERRKKRRQKK